MLFIHRILPMIADDIPQSLVIRDKIRKLGYRVRIIELGDMYTPEEMADEKQAKNELVRFQLGFVDGTVTVWQDNQLYIEVGIYHHHPTEDNRPQTDTLYRLSAVGVKLTQILAVLRTLQPITKDREAALNKLQSLQPQLKWRATTQANRQRMQIRATSKHLRKVCGGPKKCRKCQANWLKKYNAAYPDKGIGNTPVPLNTMQLAADDLLAFQDRQGKTFYLPHHEFAAFLSRMQRIKQGYSQIVANNHIPIKTKTGKVVGYLPKDDFNKFVKMVKRIKAADKANGLVKTEILKLEDSQPVYINPTAKMLENMIRGDHTEAKAGGENRGSLRLIVLGDNIVTLPGWATIHQDAIDVLRKSAHPLMDDPNIVREESRDSSPNRWRINAWPIGSTNKSNSPTYRLGNYNVTVWDRMIKDVSPNKWPLALKHAIPTFNTPQHNEIKTSEQKSARVVANFTTLAEDSHLLINVTMLIRLLEWAREDAPDDDSLHALAQKMLEINEQQKHGKEFTIADADALGIAG